MHSMHCQFCILGYWVFQGSRNCQHINLIQHDILTEILITLAFGWSQREVDIKGRNIESRGEEIFQLFVRILIPCFYIFN